MKQTFIDTEQTDVQTIEQAYEYAPWAAEIVEDDGGFMAFESVDDFEVWQIGI